ncbi:MAG: hypothetical protein GY781_10760 [Gammaproteobacteria bacterium]|nr:hypothetical protein [Gammaproteobacteria bacterium]
MRFEIVSIEDKNGDKRTQSMIGEEIEVTTGKYMYITGERVIMNGRTKPIENIEVTVDSLWITTEDTIYQLMAV